MHNETNHDHGHEHEHEHENNTAQHNRNGKQQAKLRVKSKPGDISIERHIHDEAIVISGSMLIEYNELDINALVAEGLEKASFEIGEHKGIVGHIKAAIAETSTSMVSVTDEKAMIKESRGKQARITLSAIVFMIDSKEAETIIRKALTTVRSASDL